MKLIDEDALVAEIEKRIKTNKVCMLGLRNLDYYQGKVDALNDTISSIDTLEVKEVNLKKEIENYLSSYWPYEKELHPFLGHMAKQFFELGMQVRNKAQKGEEV